MCVNVEKHARDPILRKVRADFVDAIPQRPTDRHANGPAEFYSLDVLANSLPIFSIRQIFQPFPDGLGTSFRPEENCRDLLALTGWRFELAIRAPRKFSLFRHSRIVPCVVHNGNRRVVDGVATDTLRRSTHLSSVGRSKVQLRGRHEDTHGH